MPLTNGRVKAGKHKTVIFLLKKEEFPVTPFMNETERERKVSHLSELEFKRNLINIQI